ncbi:enoyl-CoA hydratase/isomerase family protein [Microbacterium sp. No. 7]|uniref:enoyl-CoA hydratase/isomerase family protein n=1 Tax=Microbacterium sp. No. 7 TaxID=1714373 RepID=UPI0006CF9744|nr:enoyl-CoA hydratase/isomerase family protein [Microbacterium sp. No. 7]
MDYRNLLVDSPVPHVLRVTLNRPRVANALSHALMSELRDVVERIRHDTGIHAWILTGAPREDGRPCFSAGADMKEAMSPDAPPRFPGAELANAIDDLLTPSIAVIDGVCTTGALELALAFDLRLASDRARLTDQHMERSGLAMGAWGLAARMSRLVGVDKTKELLLLSEEVSGTEAERIGLVNRVYPADELMDAALAIAGRIAGMPRRGVRATLGYLGTQADMSKHDAIRWAELTPEYMGLTLRPFKDAASRFFNRRQGDGGAEDAAEGSSPTAG